MTHKNWNDNKIEDLLSDMPDISDNRLKSEILERLKQDERLNAPRRKKSKKWMPALIAVAALLVIGLMVPSMLSQNEVSMKDQSAESKTMIQDTDSQARGASLENEAATEEKMEMDTMDRSSTMMASETGGIRSFAVYPEDVVDSTLFHLGLAGDQASSVPVTFIIPNSQIEKDFGFLEPTSYDLYNKYADRLDENALGFQEYHPYKGDIAADDHVIIHQLPQGHGYDMASASTEIYLNSLQDTFYGYQEVRFENEDGTAAVFSGAGQQSTPLILKSGRNHFNYYLIEQQDGQQFLSSNFSQPQLSVNEALQQMKVKPNDVFHPVIPSTLEFDVKVDDKLTTIEFEQPLDLGAMEPEKAMQMVEGMLLTAASFGEQLQFENVVQQEWNGFNFSQPLPVPIGFNPLLLILK
ncbi:hypothetical protein FQ087_07920 [Sporosarcina sp. ANT_H38]|uniref:hypothetical protein n=1 Tax=Sporosarcina sp. ANT_H38 TaxID=2597358 RepID=UPI0011F131A1|nr:hypothetical protein [Sporosarcina sp. ANT_H38]KAA0966161.1 hypothetical protein FQ087_07920 [Sporosarcina sp. ANT_H38]